MNIPRPRPAPTPPTPEPAPLDPIQAFLGTVNTLLEEVEETLWGPKPVDPEWDYIAFRWRPRRGLIGVAHPHRVPPNDLLCLDRQKGDLLRNTRQFVEGRPANNALLSGARGCGKSSLIKAVLTAFHPQGLRLIEVDKQYLTDLPDLLDLLYGRPERFILFCDDLSFESDDASYKSIKATLDGSIAAPPENVLIYATSNRRHLLPEYMSDNQGTRMEGGELHFAEGVEERISLSERFGLWLSFHPFNQEQYLTIVDHWLTRLGAAPTTRDTEARAAALRWALARGSRSGRIACQFARDWAGYKALQEEQV